MKLKDAIKFNEKWQSRQEDISLRCNNCKKNLELDSSRVVILYRLDNNFKIQLKIKFICYDCIKALLLPDETLFK